MLFTIVVVSYVLVPMVSRLVRTAGGYNPSYYEPKDFTRGDWLSGHGVPAVVGLSSTVVVNIALFLLLGLVWIAIMRSRR